MRLICWLLGHNDLRVWGGPNPTATCRTCGRVRPAWGSPSSFNRADVVLVLLGFALILAAAVL